MKYIKNEEAVSPVIGVILMVVITVIIAAILAVFAFGIGGPQNAPSAQLRFTATNNTTIPYNTPDNLVVTHTGGDSLILSELTIQVDSASGNTVLQTPINLSSWSGGYQYLSPGGQRSGTFQGTLNTGDIIRVRVLHVPTGQMVADARVTIQGG